jgi:hypothetical protein
MAVAPKVTLVTISICAVHTLIERYIDRRNRRK